MKGRVLIIAGSDSGGGAGIQADIKTVTSLGGFAMTAITALTAQNTEGVHGIYDVPPNFIKEQISVVLDDVGADVVKIGMLHNTDVIATVSSTLSDIAQEVPVVLDPVMVAKGGELLLEDTALHALKTLLIPRATLLTPNVVEAEALTGRRIICTNDLILAGEDLIEMGSETVLMKGGHIDGSTVIDILISTSSRKVFKNIRINTRHTHGTGCTLASACATGIAQGLSMSDAVKRGNDYVQEAIRTAPGFGRGHGPLNHGCATGG